MDIDKQIMLLLDQALGLHEEETLKLDRQTAIDLFSQFMAARKCVRFYSDAAMYDGGHFARFMTGENDENKNITSAHYCDYRPGTC